MFLCVCAVHLFEFENRLKLNNINNNRGVRKLDESGQKLFKSAPKNFLFVWMNETFEKKSVLLNNYILRYFYSSIDISLFWKVQETD